MQHPRYLEHRTAQLWSSRRVQRGAVAAALACLGLAATATLWAGSGVRGAQRDARQSADVVRQKQREVDDALRLLQLRMAELRDARAAAVESGDRLGAALDGVMPLDSLAGRDDLAAFDTLTTAMFAPPSPDR